MNSLPIWLVFRSFVKLIWTIAAIFLGSVLPKPSAGPLLVKLSVSVGRTWLRVIKADGQRERVGWSGHENPLRRNLWDYGKRQTENKWKENIAKRIFGLEWRVPFNVPCNTGISDKWYISLPLSIFIYVLLHFLYLYVYSLSYFICVQIRYFLSTLFSVSISVLSSSFVYLFLLSSFL